MIDWPVDQFKDFNHQDNLHSVNTAEGIFLLGQGLSYDLENACPKDGLGGSWLSPCFRYVHYCMTALIWSAKNFALQSCSQTIYLLIYHRYSFEGCHFGAIKGSAKIAKIKCL